MTPLSGAGSRLSERVVVDAVAAPRVVPFDAPWEWLAAGWRDLWRTPGPSLAYGAVFAGAAALMAIGFSQYRVHSLFLALAGAFMLVGPFLAVGLYEASRRTAAGQPVGLGDVARAPFSARGQLSFFGVLLMLAALAWLQIAFLLLMLFLGGSAIPPANEFVQLLIFTPRGLGLLIVGSIVGGLIALTVFAVSVVAVPMLLDRQVDAVSAGRASLAAVAANPKAMALWAALIVVMMAAGFATLLAGLVVAFPLTGHATWHAYQDIYGKR
jgi:uncharacterized membrane protein